MKRLLFLLLLLPLLEIGCFHAAMAPIKSAKRISKEISKASDPISDVEEYYIGRSVAANIVAKYPVLDNEELTNYVSLVGNTVALNSDMPVTYGGYHFAVLDTEEINAFASPGGIIFLTKGLIDSIENEDELAAVLAHEVAHINNRDGISTIEASRKSSLGTLFLKEPFRIAGTITPAELSQVSNLFIQAIDKVFDTVAVNGYSDSQEIEADKDALVYLASSGYDPTALLNYRTGLMGKDESTVVLKMENNPSPFERVENIKLNLPPVHIDESLVQLRSKRFHTYVK
jgi:beta-barrel assembly-enhancing protease